METTAISIISNGPPIFTKSENLYPAGSICMFTAVPKDVAIARFEQAPITITHGIGLIPSDNAIAIQIGVSIAAVALFDMMFVSTLVSTAITTEYSVCD